MTRLSSLAHICPLLPHLVAFNDTFTNLSVYKTLDILAGEPHVSICEFGKILDPRCSLVKNTLTDEGKCVTFNALNSHEMYTDEYVFSVLVRQLIFAI